jgi:hypothetical protein
MDKTRRKFTAADRRHIAMQIADLGMGVRSINDEQNEAKKLGTCMVTVAAAFMNPFHMDELYQIIAQFNQRKLTEELAKRN